MKNLKIQYSFIIHTTGRATQQKREKKKNSKYSLKYIPIEQQIEKENCSSNIPGKCC
jgi:hypothetical protein